MTPEVRLLALVLVAMACSRAPSRATPAASVVAAATPGSAPVVAPPPPVASLEAKDPRAQEWAELRALPPPARPLTKECSDSRVVLSGRARSDPSVLGRVKQVLVTYRAFEVVEATPSRPRQVELYRTNYGEKLFAQEAPPPERAVIAKCGDAETCNLLAAAFTQLSPKDTPRLVCGLPPLEVPWHSSAARPHYTELSPAALSSAQ